MTTITVPNCIAQILNDSSLLLKLYNFQLDEITKTKLLKSNTLNTMKGGYDVEFIKEYPDDNVTCSICLYVLREPLQSIECGHRFCESCVADLTKW